MHRVGRRVLLVGALVFAAINLGNALHKGGDFEVFLDAGRRVMDRQPLYEGSGPGAGVIGPPFQGVFFVPFAAIARANAAAAAVVWYVLNLAALACGVWWWTEACDTRPPPREARWDRAAILLPLAAIVLPAQTNFEHQNMNALLLGITGASALAWTRGRSGLGGALIGLATALKAFPALLLVVFLLRRDWRALAAGVATAIVLSWSPGLWYGPGAVPELFRQWLAVSAEGGWPTRIQNQSIVAMAARAVPSSATTLSVALIGVMFGLLIWATIGRSLRTSKAASARTLALGLAIAVLASPIAWDHYWVLMFPALHVLYTTDTRASRATFWIAAILISGLAPITVTASGLELARGWSNSTIAGMLIVLALSTHGRGDAVGNE